jgi:cobalamin synthase
MDEKDALAKAQENYEEYIALWNTLSPAQQAKMHREYQKTQRNRWLLKKVLPFSVIASWVIYKFFVDEFPVGPFSAIISVAALVLALIFAWLVIEVCNDL